MKIFIVTSLIEGQDEVIEFYKGYDMEIPREFVEKRLGTFCGVSFG